MAQHPHEDAALWMAAHQDDTQSVTRLLRARADPNSPLGPAPKRTTPLHEAALSARADAALALLSAGARTDLLDGDRNTALHACCAAGANLEVVRALVKAKADVGARNADGVTALHLAVRAAAKESVRVLVGAGADPLLADYQGLDALGYSRTDSMDQLLQQMIKATTDDVDGRLLPGAGQSMADGPRSDLPPEEAMRQAIMRAVLPDGLDEFDVTDAEYDRARALAERIGAAFARLDVNKSGAVSRHELRKALEASGARMSSREAVELFQAGDLDGDGQLTIEEFAALGPRLKSLLTALAPKRAKRTLLSPSPLGASGRPAGGAYGGSRQSGECGGARIASPGRLDSPRGARAEQPARAGAPLAGARAVPAADRGACARVGFAHQQPSPSMLSAGAGHGGYERGGRASPERGARRGASGTPPHAGIARAREDDLRRLFAAQDRDGSGLLSMGEALAAFNAHGVDTSSDAVLGAVRTFKASDLNADGSLDFDEFCKLHAAVATAEQGQNHHGGSAAAARPRVAPSSAPAARGSRPASPGPRRSTSPIAARPPSRMASSPHGARSPLGAASALPQPQAQQPPPSHSVVLSIDRVVVEPWLLAQIAPPAPPTAACGGVADGFASGGAPTFGGLPSPAAALAEAAPGSRAAALTVLTRAFEPSGAAESLHHTPHIPIVLPLPADGAVGGASGGSGGVGAWGSVHGGSSEYVASQYGSRPATPTGAGFALAGLGESAGLGQGVVGSLQPTGSGTLNAHLRVRHRLVALSGSALVDFTLVVHGLGGAPGGGGGAPGGGGGGGGGGAFVAGAAEMPPTFLADGRLPLAALLAAAQQALGGADGLGVGASGSASAIQVPLLDARERIAATLHVTAQPALDASADMTSASVSSLLPSSGVMRDSRAAGAQVADALRDNSDFELAQLKASHDALLRVHVALQAEVRRSRHALSQGGSPAAIPDSMLKPHQPPGGASRRAADQFGGDWRSQPLPLLRRTVEVLDSARYNWRNSRSLVEDAHGVTATAYRQLAHYNAHGVTLSGLGLPRDVRAAVGAQSSALAGGAS